MRSQILLVVLSFSLFSCKIITLDDEQIIADIPEGLELIKISAGIYTSGEKNNKRFLYYDYKIMQYPVTNLQYVEFLRKASENSDITITIEGVTGYYEGDKNWSAGYYEFINFNDSFSRIEYYNPGFGIKWTRIDGQTVGYNNHPVTQVTWFGANAYAKYYGMRLPTKEEFEKSSRANTSYKYPWGNEFDSTKVNFRNSGDIYDNNTTPVGFYNGKNNTSISHSPYGIYDLSGNVWEWTDSWKDQSPGKVLKGGSWLSSTSKLPTWIEQSYGYSPKNRGRDIGFRCVKIL